MTQFNAHKKAVEIERDRAKERLDACESNGATLEEYRVRLGEYKQLEHRLIWFQNAPKSWFR